MKYQSEIIHEILEQRGHKKSSLHYQSECIETWIEETKGAYPKLCDYESEWLNYINKIEGGGTEQPNPNPPIGEFPYVTLTDVTEAIVDNVVPYAYKSAVLKGNTEVITGKNLFNGNLENGGYSHTTGVKEQKSNAVRSVDFIKVEPSSTICCSNNGKGRATHIFEYDENKQFLKFNNGATKVDLLPSTKYVTFYGGNTDRNKMQIEYGEEPTYYEEYRRSLESVEMPILTTSNEDGTKTIILTVNEDVKLGSVGEIKDELDLLTGQLTQRIDEDGEVLSQEVVKTVELTITDESGNKINHFIPIEGTMHIQTDGEPVKPTVTMEIPVEAITQNLSSFIEGE